MTRGWVRLLAWGTVGLTIATIPSVRLIVAQPHPGQLGMEGREGTPLVYVGVSRSRSSARSSFRATHDTWSAGSSASRA